MRRFEWDDAKAESNHAKHGVAFEKTAEFEFASAVTFADERRDYGEPRLISYGFIGSRLHALVYTQRGETIRVISLRKANEREVRFYSVFVG